MKEEPRKGSVQIFLSYAHEDRPLVEQLEKHLAPLKRLEMLSTWSDQEIRPGGDWEHEISGEIARSDIVLLFVSSDYLASIFSEREIAEAMRAAEARGTRVVPVILRPSAWQRTPLAQWQVLPRDGRAVTEHRNTDEAWAEIVRRIEGLIADLTSPGAPVGPPAAAVTVLPLYEVFKPSGTPSVTFVEPPRFAALKLSLAQPGRGLVVEGPSGIGKTTALRRAQDALDKGLSSRTPPIEFLSARRSDHVSRLANLPSDHVGTVVVDDFHRLPKALRDSLADYLKYLADYEDSNKKLVIAGIPRIGERIVQVSFDLATRLDVFRLGRVDDSLVLEMIQKGERALNVRFSRPNEIATVASGSLNVAQLLCFHLCALNGIEETQPTTRSIRGALDDAVARVMEQIEPKYGSTARVFASLGGRRDLTTIEILRELSRTPDGFVSLEQFRSDHPNLSDGIERFVKQKQVDRVYESVPDSRTFLLFDYDNPALVIDDPQLAFFLEQTPTSKWMRVAGKTEAPKRDQVFVSYSHHETNASASAVYLYAHDDDDFRKDLEKHLASLAHAGVIEVWSDREINAGVEWAATISEKLDAADIIVLLISPAFLASEFIHQKELVRAMERHDKGEARVIPVFVKHCDWKREAFGKLQGAPPMPSLLQHGQITTKLLLSLPKRLARPRNPCVQPSRDPKSSCQTESDKPEKRCHRPIHINSARVRGLPCRAAA